MLSKVAADWARSPIGCRERVSVPKEKASAGFFLGAVENIAATVTSNIVERNQPKH